MTLDHVNKYLLHDSAPAMFNAGRVAMPIFSMVLAFNLARPGALAAGVHARVMTRLAIAGAVATLPFVALGGLGWNWWPLNIMFTLLVATAAIKLMDSGHASAGIAAAALLVCGGLLVEFWWPALAVAVATWSYSKRANWPALLLVVAALASLQLINHNAWALAALPVVLLASLVDVRVPKMRWVFYVFYPAHLALIWLIRSTMS